MKNFVTLFLSALALSPQLGTADQDCITGDEFLERDPNGSQNGTKYEPLKDFTYDYYKREISLEKLPEPNLDKAMYLWVTLANAAVRPSEWCYDVKKKVVRLNAPPLHHMGANGGPYGDRVWPGWIVWINYVKKK